VRKRSKKRDEENAPTKLHRKRLVFRNPVYQAAPVRQVDLEVVGARRMLVGVGGVEVDEFRRVGFEGFEGERKVFEGGGKDWTSEEGERGGNGTDLRSGEGRRGEKSQFLIQGFSMNAL
jgi:hypothetical protein